MMQKIESVSYKTALGNVQVSMHYSGHRKRWYVMGTELESIETGGSNIRIAIKSAMKEFIRKHNLEMEGRIRHDIYNIYSVYLVDKNPEADVTHPKQIPTSEQGAEEAHKA